MEQRGVTDSALDDYIKIEKIEGGAYGTVHKCLHKKTNRVVAMKEIHLREYSVGGIPSNILRAISILKEVKHPNIVSLLDFIVEFGFGSLYLIFELCLSMDLQKRLASLDPCEYLSRGTIKSYLHQILHGTLFCHDRRILHRDLKPENLLLTGSGVIKLADFGFARVLDAPIKGYAKEVVTLFYTAPELLLGCENYSYPIDIWSIGCIFSEMGTKKVLFDGDSEFDQLKCIFRVLKTPTDDMWPGLSNLKKWQTFPCWEENNLEAHATRLDRHGIDLLQKMLTYDPSERISARDALRHPYFDDLDTSNLPANNL